MNGKHHTWGRGPRFALPLLACCLLAAGTASAELIITKVLPSVSTAADRGDTVEIFNTGPGAVDLTDYVLTDLDPGATESDPTAEPTFAPAMLAVPPLQPGDFAVVVFVDSTGGTLFQFWETNYGLLIHAPLATAASSYLGSEHDQLLLADGLGTTLDYVAWQEPSNVPSMSSQADLFEDVEAMTAPTFDYYGPVGEAEWAGPDSIADLATWRANCVSLAWLHAVGTYGNGAMRRLNTGSTFDVATPDGPAQWETVPRHEAILGNFDDDQPGPGGFAPIRMAGDFAAWVAALDSTNAPWRRIARDQNADPPDFAIPPPMDHTAFEGVLQLAMASQWTQCFAAAIPLGYEVVEYLDLPTGNTFHVLRERTIPGGAGFRGQGIFIFNASPMARNYLVLQAPHPRWDTATSDEAGLAFQSLRARVLMIAGAHRNNHPDFTLCDGSLGNGDDYHISDVAHHPDNFFHTAHKFFLGNIPNALFIQFHGFCCPGEESHDMLSDDTIVSDGFDHVPGMADFSRLLEEAIEAQMFLADDGSMNGDLTTAGLYGEEVFSLGGTTNLQARVTNGVPIGMECDTPAVASTARFIHLEQDPDVREEPQHIIDAMEAALQMFELTLSVDMAELGAVAAGIGALPEVSWRTISEIDNVGFHVYLASIDGARQVTIEERLTESPVPAAGDPDGAGYSFIHAVPVQGPDDVRHYLVSDIDALGTETFHGPVTLQLGVPSSAAEWELY